MINTHAELLKLTNKLIDEGLALDFNLPITTSDKVTWSSRVDFSKYLDEYNLYFLYKKFLKNREFLVLFKDGSLIQMYYEFSRKRNLTKHRLLYFDFTPIESINMQQEGIEPNLDTGFSAAFDINETYLEQIEDFYEQKIDDEIYLNSNLINKIGFLRFDYDQDAAKEIEHPASHLTINKEGVRIPVQQPLTPYEFLNFVLTHYKGKELPQQKQKVFFGETIFKNEKDSFHIKLNSK